MAIQIRLISPQQTSTSPVALRCPWCGNSGTFEAFGPGDFLPVQPDQHRQVPAFGFRRCPNPSCQSLVYVLHRSGAIVDQYPVRRLDFDRAGVPDNVAAVFDEAIGAHSGQLWMAAGMMIRKTLEEICLDQGAEGPNLQQRIAALGGKIVIPRALIEGMDHLRLLGNDAAHVEIRHFQVVSQQEIEVGIEFTKEILRATYQYDELLSRLASLRNPPA